MYSIGQHFCQKLVALVLCIPSWTFVNPGWGSCELDYNLGMFGCPVYKKIYPIYKKLESNDIEILFPVETNILPTPNSKNLGK